MFSLDKFRGKVSLVVNVASKCGYTDAQYKGLVWLQNKFSTHDFNILAFPCNQFWEQEPGTISEVLEFVKNYNVNFYMFNKVNVTTRGWKDVDPLWKYIGEEAAPPSWNFWKYLVDQSGKIVGHWAQNVEPQTLYDDIKSLVSQGEKTSRIDL